MAINKVAEGYYTSISDIEAFNDLECSNFCQAIFVK